MLVARIPERGWAANQQVTPEPFDPEIVASLRSLGGDGEQDAFVYLTTLFVASGEELLGTLREALARGDTVTVGDVAHTLKGSAGNLGALRLADACRQLEDVLASGSDVGDAAARVVAEFEQIPPYLQTGPGSA
jgi:HPt (histidine-containing phosphotransfer) domain-containing protein